jgi:macrolide-specific efflux system membrane fusion protein
VAAPTEPVAIDWVSGTPPGDGPGSGRPGWSRRRLIAAGMAGAVAISAGTAAGVWAAMRRSGTATAASVSISSQNVPVTTGTIEQTVAATGTVVPAQDSNLTFTVSGTISAVDVKVGQPVDQGQVLANLDTTALSDIVAADQETLTAAQDRLSTDQADNAAASTLAQDQAEVISAENTVNTAQTNLADATLTAPFAGTVAAVGYAVGDTVDGGSGGGGGGSGSVAAAAASGSTASGITLISTGSYDVDATVDDTEVSQIQTGDQAVITVTGATGNIYGTVSSVSLIGSSSSSGTSTSPASFPIVIAVTGSPSGLYAGASASVSIITRVLQNVVEVPTAAISYANGQATVTEVVGGAKKSQVVTTGASEAGMTQITSGLSAGDVVVERVVKLSAGGATRTLFGGRAGGGAAGVRTGGGGFGGGGFGGGGFGGGGFGGGGFGGGGGAG